MLGMTEQRRSRKPSARSRRCSLVEASQTPVVGALICLPPKSVASDNTAVLHHAFALDGVIVWCKC